MQQTREEFQEKKKLLLHESESEFHFVFSAIIVRLLENVLVFLLNDKDMLLTGL